ncbi:MAG: hypothetical protein R2712_09900 [Vicinamibacterales bacterium]
MLDEHTAEATSQRVEGTLAHRDELWDRCYEQLMTAARERIEQEVARLGGHYAHVLDESVDSRHDDRTEKRGCTGSSATCSTGSREEIGTAFGGEAEKADRLRREEADRLRREEWRNPPMPHSSSIPPAPKGAGPTSPRRQNSSPVLKIQRIIVPARSAQSASLCAPPGYSA